MSDLLKSKTLFYIYLLILVIPCFEIALLLVGYRPYQQIEFQIKSEPANCIIPSSQFGFALHPGLFEVTINDGLKYTATHSIDSLRICSIESMIDSLTQPSIYLFGCSYTYGMGIDDDETFAFKLQNETPQYQIVNFGVPGFGNVQSYLQLKEQIDRDRIPTIAIVNYADFHVDRNVLSDSYRRDLHMGFQRSTENIEAFNLDASIPYVQHNGTEYLLSSEHWQSLYSNWPGRQRFASVNLIQNVIEYWSENKNRNNRATLFLFEQIQSLCDEHGIELIVTGLTKTDETNKMLSDLAQKNIQTEDISLNLTLEQFNNLPFDSHPNAAAHDHYAQKISKLIHQTNQ